MADRGTGIMIDAIGATAGNTIVMVLAAASKLSGTATTIAGFILRSVSAAGNS